MADGRTARPGHVTPERALCASSAPSTASPHPPRARPLLSLLYSLSRSSVARRGPLKGTGSGVHKRVARVPSRTRSAGSRARLERPASLGPALPRIPGVTGRSSTAAGGSAGPGGVWLILPRGDFVEPALGSPGRGPRGLSGAAGHACAALRRPPPALGDIEVPPRRCPKAS